MRLSIIGLGYVGLPLATAFSRHYDVIGFDIDTNRVAELTNGHDRTREVDTATLRSCQAERPASSLRFTTSVEDLRGSDVFVVTVPTPVDRAKKPDLGPMKAASRTIGSVLAKGATVIYECTVYPGATVEECVPILEASSGLTWKKDFFVGYSPERINPGDPVHRLETIVKIVAGDTEETGLRLERLYGSIVNAGIYRADSIETAEAAKVIENCQRDINIAFVNELAVIFSRMGLDTRKVLEAAGTKWNFLPFRPGLVGGHCIGVDPYYLTYKAQMLGYHPEVILSGRRINDGMGRFVARQVVKELARRHLVQPEARVLILGITFKENCPDTRNSQVPSIAEELAEFGFNVSIHDPHADAEEVRREYGLELVSPSSLSIRDSAALETGFAAIIHAVAHTEFKDQQWNDLLVDGGLVYDVKGTLPPSQCCCAL
jgi:UDP-N-acetyl-D-galactosamine dehydrogenase